jgi:AcrR family transcriptional regulator
MPKRDAAYMSDQRRSIARAVLAVLLEKGVYDTSLREMCERADVSIGAFYNHFPTKADAIVAARYLDLTENIFIPPASNWREYVASYAEAFCSRDKHQLQRRRLSLQFAAEILQMQRNLEGLPAVYDVQRDFMRANLKAVFDGGEVSLPFGLERTVEIHAQIGLGASYRLSNDLDLTVEAAVSILEDGLAATAGLIRKGKKR